MKYIKYLYLLAALVILHENAVADFIKIVGSVKGIPSKKVYLADAYSKVVLDSADYKNDRFTFNYKYDKNTFEPFLVCLRYDNSRKVLFVLNNVLPKRVGSDAFMLEPGVIRLTGDIKKDILLKITAGSENTAFFTTENFEFGSVRKLNDSQKSDRISSFISVIKKFPSSYYLLSQIAACKQQYTNIELKKIILSFDPKLQNSPTAKYLATYAIARPNHSKRLRTLTALNENAEKESITYNNKLTVLVFWASWCGPCRAEIPLLKNLYNTYKNKGMNIISISVDRNNSDWHQALLKEKLPWKQAIIDQNELVKVKDQFDFSAIPTTIIVDHSGYEVKRYTGMSNVDFKALSDFVGSY